MSSSLLRTSATEGLMAAGGLYVPVPVQTSAYTASPGDFVPVDTTSGSVTITLPAEPADQTTIAVKMVRQGSTNTVTVAAGGADAFNLAGGSQTATLTLLSQAVFFQYEEYAGIWYVLDHLGLGQLDLRYTLLAAAPGYGESVAGFGLALASCQPLYTAAAATVNETLYAVRCTARESATITKLGCWVTTAGVTAGAGVNELAIASAAGTILQATGDMTTAFESTGIAEGTITGQAVVAGTDYWLLLLSSYTGTVVHYAGASAAAAIPEINGVYSAGSVASQATMPASITPSSLTGLAAPPFLYGR